MIDPAVQPRSPIDTSAGYGAGRYDRQGAPSGFSDALKGADRQATKSDDDDISATDTAADTSATDDAGDTLTTSGEGEPAKTSEPHAQSVSSTSQSALTLIHAARLGDKTDAKTTDVEADTNATEEDAVIDADAATDGKTTDAKPGKGLKDRIEAATDGLTKPEGAEAAADDATATGSEAASADQTPQSAVDALMLLVAGKAGDVSNSNTAMKTSGTDARSEKVTSSQAADAASGADMPDSMAELADLLKGSTDAAMGDDGAGTGESGARQTLDFKAIRLDREAKAADAGNVETDGASKSSTSGGTPTIGVLESRRIIAPVSTSNSANLVAAMNGDADWVSALRNSAIDSATQPDTSGKVLNMLKLQMTPIDLGSVTATLKLTGETLNVHLTVENSAAYRKLSDDHSEIMKSLRAQGYAVDSVQISIASTDRSSANGNQMSGQQQGQGDTGQQSFAGTQQGSSGGNQGQGAFTTSGNSNRQTGSTGDEAMAAALVDAGTSGAAGGSGVYL